METGRWHGHVFEVSPNVVRDFSDLIIKGGMATDEKVGNKQAFKTVKNSNPVEVSFKVALHAALGCNVREEAIGFIMDAENGADDWMYINGQKLIDCKLMLTEADVSVRQITPNGTWIYCELTLQFRQSSQFGGSTNGVSSSSSKSSGGGSRSSGGGGGGGGSSTPGTTMTKDDYVKLTKVDQANVTSDSKKASSGAYLSKTVSDTYASKEKVSSTPIVGGGNTSKITRVTR